MLKKTFIFLGILSCSLFTNLGWANSVSTQQLNYEVQAISSQAPDLNREVLFLALKAYHRARNLGLDNKQILTIIDYSKPSTENRLYVVDLKNYRVPFDTLVAHGQNSGFDIPENFSDQPGSLQSSLGVFVTRDSYIGHDGYALRLQGLEQGFNAQAYSRNIVMHGAWYVSNQFARAYGRLGRSSGCPAIEQALARPVINTIKNGTIIFAYFPDRHWLYNSRFLA